ncbi:MAG: hypothetical protein R3E18_11450 [Sphingomonadaceae bacterium]|nr:hypothetical protein [Sphingomonadaceae bacterium]
MKTLHRSLVIGCSMLALAGCGGDEIVSPGTGGNITINNSTSTPAPTPTPTPTSTLVTPANGCPTISDPQGLTDEGTITGPTGEYRICTLPARFNTSSTLPQISGLLYRMAGRVDVGTDGGPTPDASDGFSDTDVTLTIEPGVIIYASGSSFLMVNRGNQINAVGTAAKPIIFTSRDNVLGLNNDSSSGQWGGVVLGGRAPVTDCSAPGATPGTINCERQVEGAAQPALFGGATNNDSSGRMEYVQIRYSGFVLSGDNELQSLTTGGTGTGTVLNHIMSYNSSDDGVEFFGGFVNVKHLIVVGAEDDGLDTDTGVKANMQYVVVIQRPGAGDTIIEADSSNAAIDNTPRQNTQISNATFVHQNPAASQAIRIRGGADYTLTNTVVSAPNSTCLRIDDAETLRAANAGLDDVGPVVFQSVVLACNDPFRSGSNGVSEQNVTDAFNAGTNNNSAYTATLTNLFINGANEDALTAFNASTLITSPSSFFDNAGFVGAVRSSDTWQQGWTCDSSTVAFGSNTGSCASLPVF